MHIDKYIDLSTKRKRHIDRQPDINQTNPPNPTTTNSPWGKKREKNFSDDKYISRRNFERTPLRCKSDSQDIPPLIGVRRTRCAFLPSSFSRNGAFPPPASPPRSKSPCISSSPPHPLAPGRHTHSILSPRTKSDWKRTIQSGVFTRQKTPLMSERHFSFDGGFWRESLVVGRQRRRIFCSPFFFFLLSLSLFH